MTEHTYKDDFTHEEGREAGLSGILISDANGYRRALFTPKTLEALTATFSGFIDSVLRDYKKIDRKRKKNLDAHEGTSDKGDAITIPVVKRDANQQLAWLLNTLFSKDPFITVKPLEAGNVQLIVTDEEGQVYLDTVTTEEEAKALQQLVNFYLIDKIEFKKTIRTFCTELLRDGARPPVLKVIHEKNEYEVPTLDIKTVENYKDEEKPERYKVEKIEKDPLYKTVTDGEPSRIECVPGDKFFIPLPFHNIQSAPYVFQEFEEDIQTTKDKIASGVYDFCKEESDQDEIDQVLCGAGTKDEVEKYRVDGRLPEDPGKTSRRFELWFDYPFATVAEGAVSVKMIRFCAVFDWPSKKFLNCYENIYWHQKRPFFAGRMQERPFSFSGYSTSENAGPFQRYISQLFHLQVQNKVIANMKLFPTKKTSSAYSFLAKTKLRPGLVIPIDDDGDIKGEQMGTPIGSIAEEIAYLNGENEKMTVVNDTDRGAVPGRTPVGTLDRAQQLAKMQNAAVLDLVRETIADAVKCFVQTLIQFSPEGIAIPFKDPATKSLIERVINFPRDVVISQFAFEVTATAEDETPQALTTRDMMLSNEVSRFANESMAVASAVWVPGVPPPFTTFGTKLILGKRRMTARLLTHAKLNPDDFLPTDQEIEQIPIQLLQLQMQMMQMGGQGVQAAAGGGALPPGPGIGGPTGLLETQPNDAGGLGGGAPETLPPM